MLCGTNAFIRDMRTQFYALCLPALHIIADHFQFR
jgi:hypothetical protein